MKLELSQRVMLERQAFLASLKVSNGPQGVTGLEVYVSARDASGQSVPTHFTITPTVPTALGDLPPGGTAEQQWIIVPAYIGLTEPATYTLQATLAYTINGTFQVLKSLPEIITVEPQPEVHVEYFLPRYVRAGEPFLLGVTAENRGAGTARNLRITSAQPVITDQADEPVSFNVEGTFQGGSLHAGDMLLDFGDVAAGEVITGGWMMVASHHGQFTKLNVRCEHLDYQGMALSNLVYCDGGENIFRNDLQYLNADECPDASTCDKQGCVGGPINTRTGNYGYATTDLALPTAGQPLVMERHYNSTNVLSDTDSLGPGWTHRYAMRLEFPDMSDGVFFTATTGDEVLDRSTIYYRPYVMVRLPEGSRLRLANNGDGTYTAYPGAQTRLEAHGAGEVITYTLTAADQTTRVFDGEGRLRLIRDRHGNETELSYDGEGRLVRVAGPTGLRWLDLGYVSLPPGGGTEGGWRLAWVRDPISRTVQYGYDAAGDLTVVTDTQGLAWTYTYTGTHLLHEVFDPGGDLVERTEYASATLSTGETIWRAVYQEDGAGVPLALTYDEHATTVAEAGRETVHEYDFFGALVGRVDAAGQAQSSDYNWDFRPERTTDALGRATQMAWNDCCGSPTAITDTLGHVTQMAYDGSNNLTALTDAAGHTSHYVYDGDNNLVAQSDAAGSTVRYGFDEYGHVISTTNQVGDTTLYGYDGFGQRTAMTDTLGHVTTYGYDAAGRLVTITDHASRTTLHEYDDGDNLIRVTYNVLPGYPQNWQGTYNLVTEYGYDEVGRRVVTTDTLGTVSRSEYDAGGRLVRSIQNHLPDHPQNWHNTYNLVTEYGYDEAGRQVLVTDTLGSVSYTEYDELGRVARTWQNHLPGHPQNYYIPPFQGGTEGGYYNLVTDYGYDAVGNQVLVTDTLGSVTYTEYDELNRVARTLRNYLPGYPQNYGDTYNLATEYGYDVVGNQEWFTDTLGHVTYTEYDDLNRPVTVTANYVDGVFDPGSSDEDLVRVTTYDEAGRVAQVTDHANAPESVRRTTAYEYDALSRQVAAIQNHDDGVYDPAEPDRDIRSETVYDALGQVAARVLLADERIVTAYEYDTLGRPITTTDALSGTSATRYDVLGRRVETIDAEGNVTRYTYDAAGRLAEITDPQSQTTHYQYDALGRRIAVTDPLSRTSVYTYNPAGQLIAQADPASSAMTSGGVTQYGYDALGRRAVITDADGVAFYTFYDSLGRVTETRDALGHRTQYGYDALGRQVQISNPKSQVTRYEYDNAGRLVAVVENWQVGQPASEQVNVRTEYTYDGSGNLAAVRDALGHTTVYTYDLAGRRVAEEDPLGNVTRYEYDGHGRRVGEVYPDEGGPITVTTDYNALGWPTRIEYPAVGDAPGFTVELGYDALGHREVVTDAMGTMSYDYDALYRPLGIEAPCTGAMNCAPTHYTYDAAGQRTHLVYPTGEVVTYTHDAAGRLVQVADWAGGVTVYTYTVAGRLSGMQLPNGIVTHYGYDAAGRLVEIEHRDAAGGLLARYAYTLDEVGNRVQVEETIVSPETEPHGPGDVTVTVHDTDGTPEQGLKVYAFEGTHYTGFNGTTDAAGRVLLAQLPEGSYRFRADKNSTQFWGGAEDHCAVPSCTEVEVTTTVPVVVSVEDTGGNPEVGLKVYAFDGPTYTGYNRTTDTNGQATFTLPQGDYRFRADKNGTQFWSGETSHCSIPGCTATAVTTTIPVVVMVADTSGTPEPGLKVYAFDGAHYTGYNKTTDDSGQATFTLPSGDHRFRADKADAGASGGTQFWSGETNHCSIPGCTATAVTTTIPVTVTVQDSGGSPEAGLKVYAFDGADYTGYNKTTDASGQVTFTLPQGSYRFRADKADAGASGGTQYWSGAENHCAVPGCTAATVTIASPDVTVTVQDTEGTPEQGLKVYVFDGPTYTGFNGTTNVSGTVTFTLPEGDYHFRADKNSTQFWSGAANHCAVPGCAGAVVTTTIPVVVTVENSGGSPEAGLPVYVFDGTDYTGYNKTTDTSGQATFTLPLGDYRFRADKNGTQYWSGTMNHCAVPGCTAITVTIASPDVTVTVQDTDGAPELGLKVYVFDGPTYTGFNGTTNVSGTVTFTLPEGDYHFRVDKNGTQFWSGAANHCAVPGCADVVVTTTIPLVVAVADTSGSPEAGLKVYAFDGPTYTGYNKTTDTSGQVTFTLPVGDYRFRADKNGTQFWSGAEDHCSILGCTATAVTTTIPVTVSVQDSGGNPEAGLKVYAFDGTHYTGYNKTSDASGQATFTLPQGNYRFRVDKDGTQFWSSGVNHCTLPGCTAATVTTSGQAMRPPAGGPALALADPGLLLMLPLTAVTLLNRKKRGRRCGWPVACTLLVVAVMGVGTSLVEAGSPVVGTPVDNVAEAPRAQAPVLAALSSSATGPSRTEPRGAIVGSLSAAPAAQPSGLVTTTRVISYTYDPLGRLTGAEYSTGESYEYQYDAVGNRAAMTDTQGIHTYTYDAANRLTSVDGVAYTWDDRGNLVGDGTFTYAYNAAGRLVRTEGITATLVYTYNASGLRVAQSVSGTLTTFAWDWASGLPEMLATAQPTNPQSTSLYLVGHETLGQWDGDEWAYYLPDALGSVRQVADGTGAVVSVREWTPYGVEIGGVQAGLGYTGEWQDADVGLMYLRARWLDAQVGRFTRRDPWEGDRYEPQTLLHNHLYVLNNPINHTDPTGRTQNFSCHWPTTNLYMVLDGQIWRIDNQLCQALDNPGASLKLIEDFYRRIVIPGLMLQGAPDAALILDRSLDEKTTPYQVTLRLGQQLMEAPDHVAQFKVQEEYWLAEVKQKALAMQCGEWGRFKYASPALTIRAYNTGETTNVRLAMATHTAWFTWEGVVYASLNGFYHQVTGYLQRDIADYSDWHGDPHDYDGDGVLECPAGVCGKTAGFDLASLPGFLLAPGEKNTKIIIPDDWMARLVVGSEASYPGFGIYFNTLESFQFTVRNWDWSKITVGYRLIRWGDRYRESEHEIEPGYAPP